MSKNNGNDCACRLATEVGQLKAVVNAQSKMLSKLVKQINAGCKKDEEITKKSTLSGSLNPCLKCLKPDILYHLGMDTETTDFPKVFGDVRDIIVSLRSLQRSEGEIFDPIKSIYS